MVSTQGSRDAVTEFLQLFYAAVERQDTFYAHCEKPYGAHAMAAVLADECGTVARVALCGGAEATQGLRTAMVNVAAASFRMWRLAGEVKP